MLSLIQVLGYTGYNATSVPELEGPFTIPCDENAAEKKHHLYLQARVEYYSAYSLYVKVGFTLHAETLADLIALITRRNALSTPTSLQMMGTILMTSFNASLQ